MKFRAVALGLAISVPIANAYTGDLTYYTPGQGSCGETNTNGDAIVAISHLLMSNPANPNANPVCNKQISIHNPTTGTNTIATVTDTCMGCAIDDIDVPQDLFNIVAPSGNGRVHGIEWTTVGGWTFPGAPGDSDSTPAQSSASPAVQPSSTAAAAVPSAVLPTVSVQEKVAAVVPSPAAAALSESESSSSPVAPSVSAAAPAAASLSAAQQPSSAPASSSASCTTEGQTVCSADGTQVGTCTTELTVQLGPVAAGTKCVGGYQVMANSRLRSRRD
ncbi:hypothetical protein IMSHALPRED_002207 [Imshaugia aleurites]|uniref:Uncharacterized protein n=1 Tax=Imshaugia aleurites TaxID=172621 RepID=A0A8H3J565_9LECA|nr:hypothetical protein IMSHALPRED_002207 [Imshaugia aleurites]